MSENEMESLLNGSGYGLMMRSFITLARRAGAIYRRSRNASLIIQGIEVWMSFAGLSKSEANTVLTSVRSDIALRNSVV